MKLASRHAALSDIGLHRTSNEDAYLAAPPLFAVADGMGGAQAGEVASQTAVGVVGEAVAAGAGLVEAAAQANARIYALAEGSSDREGMGTTLTALRLRVETAELVHVGDSRAYRLRGTHLRQLTEDHSLVGEWVREGQLTPAEAMVNPYRSVLSRALGTEKDVPVDTREVDLKVGDRFLLCSDGLCGLVPDERIAELLAHSEPDDAALLLVREAKNYGGHDNITVLVVDVVAADAAEAPAATDSERTLVRSAAAEVGDEATTGDIAQAAAPAQDVASVLPGEPQNGAEAEAAASDSAAASEGAPAQAGVRPSWRGLGRRRGLTWLLVAALVVAALVLAFVLIAGQLYFVGVDDGYVAVYRGLPYSPLGIDLHRLYLRSDVPMVSVPAYQQARLTSHEVTGKEAALAVVANLQASSP